MRDLNWIQGSGSTSLHGQESVNVIDKKGIQKGTQRAALFQAFVGRNLPGNFVAINKKAEASCVHGLDDISQILWSLNFLQVSPKFLSWNTATSKKRAVTQLPPLGKVRLHRYICLSWGASERKLGKSLIPYQKDPRKNQGKRARHLATK